MNNFSEQFMKLFRLPLFYVPFIFSLLLNLLIWLMIILRMPVTSSWIPLHYNAHLGIDWIGPWILIFIYPGIGLLAIIVNTILIYYLSRQEPVFLPLLSFISLLVQLIILTGIIVLLIKYFV